MVMMREGQCCQGETAVTCSPAPHLPILEWGGGRGASASLALAPSKYPSTKLQRQTRPPTSILCHMLEMLLRGLFR